MSDQTRSPDWAISTAYLPPWQWIWRLHYCIIDCYQIQGSIYIDVLNLLLLIAFCYFHCSLDSIWDQGLSCPIVHISLMYNFWKLLSYFLFCFPWIKIIDVTLSLPAVHNSLPFLLAKGGNDPKSLHSLQRTLLLSRLTNAVTVLHIREIIEIIFQNLNVIDEC